jgi:hypothetical protein
MDNEGVSPYLGRSRATETGKKCGFLKKNGKECDADAQTGKTLCVDLAATLPPAVQSYATIQNAQFKNAGSGRLMVILDGEVQITNEQVQALSKQVKERIASQ